MPLTSTCNCCLLQVPAPLDSEAGREPRDASEFCYQATAHHGTPDLDGGAVVCLEDFNPLGF